LQSTEGLERCDRELDRRLRSLSREELEAGEAGVLKPGEIEGVLARRGLLVAYFEKLMRERGENEVLY
ncbi:MAG: hypothetical protein ACRD1Z_18565, partial [Vicinamibacteria bacterium]